MAEDQIQQLKEKLEAQQAQFQNYKAECKQLEEFLEEQSMKKEQEIKKLKQDAIKKDKNYKAQIGQLQSENINLKQEITRIKSQSEERPSPVDHGPELEKLKLENENSIAKIQMLQKNVKEKQQQLTNISSKYQSQQNTLKLKNNEIESLEKKLKEKEAALNESAETIKNLKTQSKPKKTAKKEEKVEKIEKTQKVNQQEDKKHLRKIEELQEELKKSEQNSHKQNKVIKELKNKCHSLQMEKEHLSKKHPSPKKKVQENIHIQEEKMSEGEEELPKNQTLISALILTKRHYVSSFLEVKNENTLKLFKSTKSGFQKSLGASKYRLNAVSHDSQTIISQNVEVLKKNIEKGIKHNSLIIYGVKKSTKKYLMASILNHLKDYFLEKIENEENIEGLYIKESVEAEKKFEMKASSKEQIIAIIQKIIQLGQKSPKKQDPLGKKKNSKPKIRYFKLIIGTIHIEIITSSHTINAIKDNSTIIDGLNQICYGKLPNILQSLECSRQIILTLNPIVNYYDDCRATLSVINCKSVLTINQSLENEDSPLKQADLFRESSLNDLARKKLQSFEKETEQHSLKTRRLQDEINYYRSKFDELQFRLKTLISTHHPQSSYLKKSPVTLSYEKMLKFVHTVLARNTMLRGKQIENMIDEGYFSGQEVL